MVGFATGSNFPDALAGGALMAKQGGPLLLAGQSLPTSTLSYLTSTKTSITFEDVFGGSTVLRDAAVTAIRGSLN
jgi:hypothetical protein